MKCVINNLFSYLKLNCIYIHKYKMSNNYDIINIDNDHIYLDFIKLLSTIYDDDLKLQYLNKYNENCALIINNTKDYYNLPSKLKKN